MMFKLYFSHILRGISSWEGSDNCSAQMCRLGARVQILLPRSQNSSVEVLGVCVTTSHYITSHHITLHGRYISEVLSKKTQVVGDQGICGIVELKTPGISAALWRKFAEPQSWWQI